MWSSSVGRPPNNGSSDNYPRKQYRPPMAAVPNAQGSRCRTTNLAAAVSSTTGRPWQQCWTLKVAEAGRQKYSDGGEQQYRPPMAAVPDAQRSTIRTPNVVAAVRACSIIPIAESRMRARATRWGWRPPARQGAVGRPKTPHPLLLQRRRRLYPFRAPT